MLLFLICRSSCNVNISRMVCDKLIKILTDVIPNRVLYEFDDDILSFFSEDYRDIYFLQLALNF